ncbi:uncharacterized protein A4U43_C07F2450 [Asparagus officinalis]|uniref:UDP-glucuronic acid decarboxylase 1 n=1 Tax=Asparagus officinalis TaxID=4686 RepID=A0A5P1EAR4_ASPOF|nr:uncharacterized protein A4U43_C07F2450 [Asparagus officinalis]
MRILVSGGAGFIGSHLVDKLMENEKNEVIVVDNFFTGSKDNLRKWIGHPRFELIRHDVTETLLVEVDQIYHLACPASPIFYKYNPVKTIKTNVIGTLNMLGLAKRVGARILLTSTSEVYGDPLQHPQTEEYWGNVNPIGVRSCYDEGKRVAETLMFDYHRQHGLVQAPGTQTRSFCYVSDMVDGLIRLMQGENTGPINIGNPGEFTMMELAETVKELINPEVPIKVVENTPDDPRQRKPDITKAKELLGWEPTVTLRQGLPMMEDDFRQRLAVPKKQSKSSIFEIEIIEKYRDGTIDKVEVAYACTQGARVEEDENADGGSNKDATEVYEANSSSLFDQPDSPPSDAPGLSLPPDSAPDPAP